jgi:hypothetical protein
MMNGGPPLIRVNVATVNNETAGASYWYGYFENGALSLSARRTMLGRFMHLPNAIKKSIN